MRTHDRQKAPTVASACSEKTSTLLTGVLVSQESMENGVTSQSGTATPIRTALATFADAELSPIRLLPGPAQASANLVIRD